MSDVHLAGEVEAGLRDISGRIEAMSFDDSRLYFQSICNELAEHIDAAEPGKEWQQTVELIFELALLANRLGFPVVPLLPQSRTENGVRVDWVVLSGPRGGQDKSFALAAYPDQATENIVGLRPPLHGSQRQQIVTELRRWAAAGASRLSTDFRPAAKPTARNIDAWSIVVLRDAFRVWHLQETAATNNPESKQATVNRQWKEYRAQHDVEWQQIRRLCHADEREQAAQLWERVFKPKALVKQFGCEYHCISNCDDYQQFKKQYDKLAQNWEGA